MIEKIRHELSVILTEATEYVRQNPREVPIFSRELHRIQRGLGHVYLDGTKHFEKDYDLFLITRGSEIQSSPTFQALERKFLEDAALRHAFRLREERAEMVEDLFQVYVAPLVAHVLKIEESGRSAGEVLDAALETLSTFVEKGDFTTRFSGPLLNFRYEGSDLELVDGVYLRGLSDSQLEAYINYLVDVLPSLDLSTLISARHELEKTVVQARTTAVLAPPDGGIQKLFDDTLTSLRLAKQGGVGFPFLRAQPVGFLGHGVTTTFFTGAKHFYGGLYEFAEHEGETVRGVLPQLKRLEDEPRFSLALRRLTDAYLKPTPGDRLIDYWIGLECLLLPGGDSELGFRAALRTAYLLSEPPTRLQTFKQTKRSYDVRSRIVHGARSTVDPQILTHTEECLRRILRRCLEWGQVPTDEMLNSLVLGAEQG